MDINSEQAASALRDVARAERRLGVFSGYRHAAPHLWLWGVIWIVGYATMQWLPAQGGWVWLVLNVSGIAAAILIGQRQSAEFRHADPTSDGGKIPQRILAIFAIVLAFIFASHSLMEPRTLVQFGAFPVLVMGMLYALAGVWAGTRWVLLGLTLMATTMIGVHLAQDYTMLWLAACGGGTLVLSGMWMRAA